MNAKTIKPKKFTYAELEEERARISLQLDATSAILACVLRGTKPDAVAKFRGSLSDSYTLKLFRATGAAGGLVLEAIRVNDSTGSYTRLEAHYLDALERHYRDDCWTGDSLKMKTAIGQLLEARSALCSKEVSHG